MGDLTVPEGWIKLNLGKIATLQRGFDLPKRERKNGQYPIISSGGWSGSHSQFKVKAPGIVMGRYGTIGKIFYIKEDYFWPLNTTLWVKDFHNNNPLFVSYLLQNFDFNSFKDKTGIPGVNRNDLHRVPILLPPLPEQQQIAEILSCWDTAIDKTRLLIKTKERQFEKLEQAIFSSSKNDKNWKTVPLFKIAKRIKTKNDQKNYPVMTISSKSGFILQEKKYNRFMAGKSLNNYMILQEGEFAYNKGNSKTYPQGCIFRLDVKKALVPQIYYGFKINKNYNSDYFMYLFSSGFLNQQLKRVINSGVRNDGLLNLRADDFFKCHIPIPNKEKQDEIAKIFHLVTNEITLLKQQCKAYETQKRGLMQKLLTGEWRVQLAEEITS